MAKLLIQFLSLSLSLSLSLLHICFYTISILKHTCLLSCSLATSLADDIFKKKRAPFPSQALPQTLLQHFPQKFPQNPNPTQIEREPSHSFGSTQRVLAHVLQRLLALLQPNEFVVHFRREIAIRHLERELEFRKHRFILRMHGARRLLAQTSLSAWSAFTAHSAFRTSSNALGTCFVLIAFSLSRPSLRSVSEI